MFKDLGIKGRVLLLTLLPTSLLAMVLGGYFTWVQLSDMRAQLIERGQLIAEQLAPLAATALARKDTAVLNRIANEALDQPGRARGDLPRRPPGTPRPCRAKHAHRRPGRRRQPSEHVH